MRAERFEKMTEEERKELRKIQISKDPNGKVRSKEPTKRDDQPTKVANKLGVSKDDLLNMDFEDLINKYKKAKDK